MAGYSSSGAERQLQCWRERTTDVKMRSGDGKTGETVSVNGRRLGKRCQKQEVGRAK